MLGDGWGALPYDWRLRRFAPAAGRPSELTVVHTVFACTLTTLESHLLPVLTMVLCLRIIFKMVQWRVRFASAGCD